MTRVAGDCMVLSQGATALDITTLWGLKKDGLLPASNPPEISALIQGILLLICMTVLRPLAISWQGAFAEAGYHQSHQRHPPTA